MSLNWSKIPPQSSPKHNQINQNWPEIAPKPQGRPRAICYQNFCNFCENAPKKAPRRVPKSTRNRPQRGTRKDRKKTSRWSSRRTGSPLQKTIYPTMHLIRSTQSINQSINWLLSRSPNQSFYCVRAFSCPVLFCLVLSCLMGQKGQKGTQKGPKGIQKGPT